MFEEPLEKRLMNQLATLFKSKQERILFMDLINNPVFQSMLLSLPYGDILDYVNRLIADLRPQDEDPPKADMPTVVEAEKSLATALVANPFNTQRYRDEQPEIKDYKRCINAD